MLTKTRAAVVGVGHFGRFHARHYASRPDVDLVAVIDTDGARAGQVAAEFGTEAATSHADLAGRVDIASVAVPTSQHYDVAAALIEDGIDVLVEKPVTATLAQADALCRAAARHGRQLHVGHVERFSSTFRALKGATSAPQLIECRRMNTPNPRAADVDVVLDLMIHDIDLAMDLAGAPVVRVDAVGAAVRNGLTDVCQARLVFANGATADLAASRIAATTDRTVRVYGETGAWTADLVAGRLHHLPPGLEAASVETLVPREDSLGREIAAFVAAARGEDVPFVGGDTAHAVLAVAEEISAAARHHQPNVHLAQTA